MEKRIMLEQLKRIYGYDQVEGMNNCPMMKLEDAWKSLNHLHLAQEWISVKDRLPELNTWVITWGGDTGIGRRDYSGTWRNKHMERMNVIAWRELPPAFIERVM